MTVAPKLHDRGSEPRVSWGWLSWVDGWCVLAGTLDATTGLLLVTDPETTLRWLGVALLPQQSVFVRFVGTFVLAVGLAYLYPFLLDRARRRERQRVVLELTALVRLLVFGFTTGAIATGALEPAWASVAATDFVVAAGQLVLLRRWRAA